MDTPQTFFELVKDRGQARVARELNLDPAIIHRCFGWKQGVNDRVLSACMRVYGARFDFDRTVIDWCQGRINGPSSPSSPPPSQPSDEV